MKVQARRELQKVDDKPVIEKPKVKLKPILRGNTSFMPFVYIYRYKQNGYNIKYILILEGDKEIFNVEQGNPINIGSSSAVIHLKEIENGVVTNIEFWDIPNNKKDTMLSYLRDLVPSAEKVIESALPE